MDYFTKTQLKERGWSERIISSFLGEPDICQTNPSCVNGPKAKLYAAARVYEAEASQGFRVWWVSIQARREAQSRQAIARSERNRLLNEGVHDGR